MMVWTSRCANARLAGAAPANGISTTSMPVTILSMLKAKCPALPGDELPQLNLPGFWCGGSGRQTRFIPAEFLPLSPCGPTWESQCR